MEGFARALAHRASDREKLLARPRKLLVPDNRTGLLSSPVTSSRRCFHIVGRFGIVMFNSSIAQPITLQHLH